MTAPLHQAPDADGRILDDVDRLARWLYLNDDNQWDHEVVTWAVLTTDPEFGADARAWRVKAARILRVVHGGGDA